MKIARVAGPIAAASRSRSSVQRVPSKSSGTSTGVAPPMPTAPAKFGQAGRRHDHLVAGAGGRGDGDLDRLHAAAGDEEALRREFAAELALVIAGERGAKLGDAALIGVEGLAGSERAVRSRRQMNCGRRKIALACPERDQAGAAAAVVEDFDDARFRRFAGLAPQRGKSRSDSSAAP